MFQFEDKQVQKQFKFDKPIQISDHCVVREGVPNMFPDERVALIILGSCHKIFVEDDDHLCVVSKLSSSPKIKEFINKVEEILKAVNYLTTRGIKHENITVGNVTVDPETQATKIVNFDLTSQFLSKNTSSRSLKVPQKSRFNRPQNIVTKSSKAIGSNMNNIRKPQTEVRKKEASPISDNSKITKLNLETALSNSFIFEAPTQQKKTRESTYGLSRISSINGSVSSLGSSFIEF
jgi:hypothetical protein